MRTNNELKRFQRFGRRNAVQKNTIKEVWCYTRVSTIDQKNNFSLKNQEDFAEQYATEHGFVLVRSFGGTYESAKDDFTRKEFNRLITEVQKAKNKPFGIIIYKMNRFSRSGGSGISLTDHLVNDLGVHLIEAVSGLDTTTDKGLLEIQKKLITAREENLNKLEHTIPGLKSFLRDGNWLGTTPMGYDHYGTRVHSFEKRSVAQEIKLNQTGKILRNAWQWKLEGDADVDIIKRLKTLGVKISSQRISAMWRNVFYCGLIANKLLDGEVVEGKQEAMVSKDVFLKVNDIVNNSNKNGYSIAKVVEERPLTNYLICNQCGRKLTSYEVKAKKAHYYKCQTCRGVSINANSSTKQPDKKGAHDMFVELLDSYHLNDKYLDLYKYQIKKMLDSISNTKLNEESLQKKQLTELKNKKEKLEERYAFGEIEHNVYIKFLTKIEAQIRELEPIEDVNSKSISNLKSKLDKAIDFTQNISKYWVSASVHNKKRIQNLMFPEGLILDPKNRQYLTRKTNTLFMLKHSLSTNKNSNNKELITKKSNESSVVAESGIEPGSQP